MTFTYDDSVYKFLQSYQIDEYKSASEFFEFLRKYYRIDTKYSDKEAYFLVIIKRYYKK